MVQRNQVEDVTDLLNDSNVRYSVEHDAIQSEGVATTDVINFLDADPESVQEILDNAAVKVSINFVDGGYQAFFESQELIDHFDSLRREGCEGKVLVHELLTDDWGPPPLGVTLEG